MAGDSNLNVIIGQGNAANELYNVKKQNYELQQQTYAQENIKKNREEKIKLQKSENSTKIKLKSDENGEGKEHSKKRDKNIEEQNKATENKCEDNLIDITV